MHETSFVARFSESFIFNLRAKVSHKMTSICRLCFLPYVPEHFFVWFLFLFRVFLSMQCDVTWWYIMPWCPHLLRKDVSHRTPFVSFASLSNQIKSQFYIISYFFMNCFQSKFLSDQQLTMNQIHLYDARTSKSALDSDTEVVTPRDIDIDCLGASADAVAKVERREEEK